MKECARCRKLIPYGSTYCDVCKPLADAEHEEYMSSHKKISNKKYNQSRDSKYIKFYKSKAWRKIAAQYASDHGFRCEQCNHIATQVHHIKAIQTDDGWNHRLDYNNLQLLCLDCHNKKPNHFLNRKHTSR